MRKLLEIELEKARNKTGIPKKELIRLISKSFGDGELPRFMKLANIPFAKELIDEISEEFKEEFSKLRKDLRGRVKDTFRIILYNLVKCTLTRQGLSLPGSKEAYEVGSYYRSLHFTMRSVTLCLKALEQYLIVKRGNTYKHKVNSYEPNKLFQLKLIPFIYAIYEEYNEDTELLIIQDKKNKEFNNVIYTKRDLVDSSNNHIMRVRSSIELDRTYIDDLEQLVKINDALKDATYALKSPVRRIYSRGHIMMGGRLYTPLANLPDRKARIRINTLLNGNPVAEVDLKANHSSMLYAFQGKQLPRDFYDNIAKESGQKREKVKWLIMKMIGAKNRAISLVSKLDKDHFHDSKFVMTQEEREFIETAIKENFPTLYQDFYKDRGVVLQSMEGDILLDAMCDLIDQGILSLPIHDALYVQQQYVLQAENALKKSWKKNLKVNFEPFVDIDYP